MVSEQPEDMGKAEEGEKSKTDKRKSRIRQMNESVKRLRWLHFSM